MTNLEYANAALDLVGLPYSSCDCIGVIRKPLDLKIAGTNWLWRSSENASKYRYAVNRQAHPPNTSEITDGQVLFRIKWNDVPKGYDDPPNAHHVGLTIFMNNRWQVIQSNPSTGVCITEYNQKEWQGMCEMKQVEYVDPVHVTELTQYDMILAIYNKIILGRA